MQASDHFELLLYIAERAGLAGSASLSTAEIAVRTGTSQQTASRRLRLLEQMQLIGRRASYAGTEVSLSEKGRMLLQQKFFELSGLFGKKGGKKLEARVIRGLGEGSYYLSQEQYLKQFRQKLGFEIFPGTLNLAVDETKLLEFLAGEPHFTVEGFSTKERSFGAIRAFRIRINDSVEGALIFPERSSNPRSVVEIVAPANLKKRFGLKEGSTVAISAGD